MITSRFLLGLGTWIFIACMASVCAASEPSDRLALLLRLRGEIVDAETGRMLPARVYLTRGSEPQFDPRAVIFKHQRDNEQNFSCDGRFDVQVTPGETTIRIERGLEYKPLVQTMRISHEGVTQQKFALERWVNMAKEGWYSGDLHGHRDLEQMKTLVLAEDVNVASVITRHNQRDYWQGKEIPDSHLIHVDETHVISQFDEEVEYLGKNTLGALIFIGMKKPIPIGDSNAAYPTLAQYADRCHEAGGFVDAEKPIWLGVAVSAALGQIDSIGIVNNHFHPRSVLPCVGNWGEIVPEKGFEGNDGLALWCMELYYRLLNCGFRIPVSGGTASGIMPSPPGYSRVYVKVPGEFSYENWVKGFKGGRSFATNGPMLSLKVDGHEIGDVIRMEKPNGSVTIEAAARSPVPLAYLEIVVSGRVAARIDAPPRTTKLKLSTRTPAGDSKWIVARAFERNDETARFAHTSPIYIEVGGKPVVSREAAAYYKSNIDKIIEFTEASTLFKNEQDRETALSIYRKARQIYADLARPARECGALPAER
ncbi:MAG: CehA/McbA family metallohydrolase [bacterium]|nr:CehA/McbA family metallohydrolase [bacterium]